jgi:predicted RNA binding protein YcfA (HicA-like mRNA interferase family)
MFAYDRLRELICRIEREGWVVRLRSGGHLELSHPRADRAVITSATPSDWRWLRNLRAQMRRALPPEPKTERTVRHARSKPPLQQRPPQQQPKRPAPVVAAVEPWSTWW